jgi:N-acetyl sugar amidotransferase
MITYCRRCVMPATKPDLLIDPEGICNACRNYENRPQVNWLEREYELKNKLAGYRNDTGSNWDCIIPVSGGKDSTFQVIKLLEYGMNPLCITASTCDLTPIGRRNIENLKRLGVDHIEISPNPNVRAKLNKIGLTQVGDISWPEHVAIFTIPVRVAVKFKIRLIVWGENSQNEYGGPAKAAQNEVLDRRWLEEFGGLLGLRVADLVGFEGLSEQDLMLYRYPHEEDIRQLGINGIFLGHYIPWDGLANVLVAQAYGFECAPSPTLGSMANYENLDNFQTAVHEYFKFLKFGFGRTTDHVSMHIRRGRLSREMGMKIVKNLDGKYPAEYLGKTLAEMLEPLEITVSEFNDICDRFTNKKIFKTDVNGRLIRDKHGNLAKINCDN